VVARPPDRAARINGAQWPSGPSPAAGGLRALPGRAQAAGDPESYAVRFDLTSTTTLSGRTSREARMVIRDITPDTAPTVPTDGANSPTQDIHA
jgi:hypothetical protein